MSGKSNENVPTTDFVTDFRSDFIKPIHVDRIENH